MQLSAIDNGLYQLFVDYFTDFAQKHIDIAHNTATNNAFVGPDDDNGNLPNWMKAETFVWLSPPELTGSDPDSDNAMMAFQAQVAIMKKVSSRKPVDIVTAKNQALIIACDMIAKMFKDKRDGRTPLVSQFSRRDYRIDPGQLERLDQYYGVLVTLNFKSLVNLEYNPAKFNP